VKALPQPVVLRRAGVVHDRVRVGRSGSEGKVTNRSLAVALNRGQGLIGEDVPITVKDTSKFRVRVLAVVALSLSCSATSDAVMCRLLVIVMSVGAVNERRDQLAPTIRERCFGV